MKERSHLPFLTSVDSIVPMRYEIRRMHRPVLALLRHAPVLLSCFAAFGSGCAVHATANASSPGEEASSPYDAGQVLRIRYHDTEGFPCTLILEVERFDSPILTGWRTREWCVKEDGTTWVPEHGEKRRIDITSVDSIEAVEPERPVDRGSPWGGGCFPMAGFGLLSLHRSFLLKGHDMAKRKPLFAVLLVASVCAAGCGPLLPTAPTAADVMRRSGEPPRDRESGELRAESGPTAQSSAPRTTPSSPGRVDPRTAPDDALLAASVGGRYSVPLAVVYDPTSATTEELGFVKSGSSEEFGPLPSGFQVRAGDWLVVWDLRDGRRER